MLLFSHVGGLGIMDQANTKTEPLKKLTDLNVDDRLSEWTFAL